MVNVSARMPTGTSCFRTKAADFPLHFSYEPAEDRDSSGPVHPRTRGRNHFTLAPPRERAGVRGGARKSLHPHLHPLPSRERKLFICHARLDRASRVFCLWSFSLSPRWERAGVRGALHPRTRENIKSGRYSLRHPRESGDPEGFNPRPPRKVGATPTGHRPTRRVTVSILAHLAKWALHYDDFKRLYRTLFQSSPTSQSGRYV